MAKAFTVHLHQNSVDSHQTNPAWVLTFIRWKNRNPNKFKEYKLATLAPLVVTNDCISVSVSVDKSSHTPSMQCILLAGDVNYFAAVAPGDFVFINMLDSQKKADEVASRAADGQAINGFHDGFKGLFKIQSTRQVLGTDPGTGVKQYAFQISGFAFTELNSVMYFNPYLLGDNANNAFLFLTNIGKEFNQLVGDKLNRNCHKILKILIEATLGFGIQKEGKKITKKINEKNVELLKSPNTHYFVPEMVGNLLGISNAKAAKHIIKFLMGIQSYAGAAEQTDYSIGLNPKNLIKNGPFLEVKGVPIQGTTQIQADYWNQVEVWSIYNQYLNSPVNEIFTTFRTDPNGLVMPTVVIRQIPFSSEEYKGSLVTRFLNLPRWKPEAEIVKAFNLGRDEVGRKNFVQVFGRIAVADDQQAGIAEQISVGNYVFDIEDVKRSGLRPYIIQNNFDTPEDASTAAKSAFKSPQWARLLADCVIGSHLKVNGTFSLVGIEEPIAVGDNFEFDDIVFHIEGLQHTCRINPDGRREFETIVTVSHGVDLRSSSQRTIYANMDNTSGYEERIRDHENEAVLPGYSDTQYISRLKDTDGEHAGQKADPENTNFNLINKSSQSPKPKKSKKTATPAKPKKRQP